MCITIRKNRRFYYLFWKITDVFILVHALNDLKFIITHRLESLVNIVKLDEYIFKYVQTQHLEISSYIRYCVFSNINVEVKEMKVL